MPKAIPDSAKSGSPGDRLVLHGSPPMGDLASASSPFVAKVELFLRIMGIDYDADFNMNGPKGKIPWITHGDVVLGDSTFIIEYLKNTYKGKLKIKEPETPQHKAINNSCLHICEGNLVYGIAYYRFLNPSGFAESKKFFDSLIPIPMRWFFPYLFQRTVRKNLYQQGLTRHSENDVNAILTASFSALSTFLGDQPYFLGDEPCETDCIVFAPLEGYLYDGTDTPGARLVRQFPNLVRFVDRLRARYFPVDKPGKIRP
ncbi:unnamed protein product [Ostreobium quekettii]|uniref:Glutathione S-transferase n=1 Tax=Ostreobium quekettii TaxID=121088 RepID=A0A8S1JJ35_9CHLO|nr:unnamed protein product [Ostreobium quekettii]